MSAAGLKIMQVKKDVQYSQISSRTIETMLFAVPWRSGIIIMEYSDKLAFTEILVSLWQGRVVDRYQIYQSFVTSGDSLPDFFQFCGETARGLMEHPAGMGTRTYLFFDLFLTIAVAFAVNVAVNDEQNATLRRESF
jgi:hypothetical protein